MDELDFSPNPKGAPQGAQRAAENAAQQAAPSQGAMYQPRVALEFFRSAGSGESVTGGKPVFSEGDKYGGFFGKPAKMYLLIEGEVGLMVKNRFFGVVKAGQLFGELAVVAKLPRTATAMAKTDCKLLTLDEKQFHAALQKKPEFALMLMGIMLHRFRDSMAALARAGVAPEAGTRGGVFDAKQLAQLDELLPDVHPIAYPAGKQVVNAGGLSLFMYVIKQGEVSILVQNKVVERVGTGGVFGEAALVEGGARTASVVTDEGCEVYGIKRDQFIKLVASHPAFGAALLKSTAERMQAAARQVAEAPQPAA